MNGDVRDYRALADAVHAAGGHVIAAADLLALTVLTPPAEWGADVAVGNSQRFGVPVGFVSTVESKAALMRVAATPWIVTEGRKGGSPVAVAIVNALLRLASGAAAVEVD